VAIGAGSVLITGGKSNSRTILKGFSLWSRRRGWVECATNRIVENAANSRSRRSGGAHEDDQPAIFGAMLGIIETESSSTQTISGILAGGMGQEGLISEDIWIWTLYGYDGDVSFIRILA
jgi:tRNA wybutosine-synthesizing protein 4